MIENSAQEKWPEPPTGDLPNPHPQHIAAKPARSAKGGHKRHLRAPVRQIARATTAKHSLKGE